MQFTLKDINKFLLFKLPSAYFVGIRIKYLDDSKSVFTVKHRWINQNPFNSLYFGVQAMAAEISTGVLVMKYIAGTGKKISMLVTHQAGTFTKKATGRITFTCEDGAEINEVIQKAIETGEGQTLILQSVGKNEEGVVVSTFDFHWGIKVK